MKRRKKKGATFLEVIISVAIIAILVIPISDLIMSSVRNNRAAEEEQNIKVLSQTISEKLKNSRINIDESSTNRLFLGYDNIELTGSSGHYSVSDQDIGNGLTADIYLDKRNDMPSTNVARDIKWDAVFSLNKIESDSTDYFELNIEEIGETKMKPSDNSFIIQGNSIEIENNSEVKLKFKKIQDVKAASIVTKNVELNITRGVENDFVDDAGNAIEGTTGYIKFQIANNIINDKDSFNFNVDNKLDKPIMVNLEGDTKEPSDNKLKVICTSKDNHKITTYNSIKRLSGDEKVGDVYDYKIVIKSRGEEVFKDTSVKNVK